MPQALPLIAVIGAKAAGWGLMATLAATLASSVVAGFLQTMMQSTPDSSPTDSGMLVNVRDTQAPVVINYGTVRVGGCQVYLGTSPDGKLLHIIQTFGEGEIEGALKHFFGDTDHSEFGSDAYIEVFTGSATQGVCSLNQYDSNFTDPMRHTAGLYARLTYNTDKYQSMPLITSLIKGIKVYDPRSGLTAWSDNPALCLYDFLRRSRYGAGLGSFWGDESSVVDCANWCEEKGYKLNASIRNQEAAMDIAERLLAGFRSRVIWSGFNFKYHPLDWDAPVLSLTEDDIKERTWKIGLPTAQDFPNTLQVTFIDAENKYTADTFPVHSRNAVNLDGEEHEKQLTLDGVTSKAQAVQMGNYTIKRLRMDRTHAFIGGPKCLRLEAGDLITVTHSTPGFNAAVVRVQKANPLPNDEVSLVVQEEDDELYDDTVDVVAHVDYATTLPNPLAPAPLPGGITFSEETYTIKDRTFSRIRCKFSSYSPYMDYCEVWTSQDGENFDFLTKAVDSFLFGPVADNQRWYFKLVPVSTLGVKEAFAAAPVYSYLVTGLTEPPGDVVNFRASVAGDTITLRWDGVDDVDLAGYELRYGTDSVIDWPGAMFFSLYRVQSVNLSGVRPGRYRFFIKAKNSLHVYSEHAATFSVQVFGPPNYAEKHSFLTNFNEGVHSNTQYYDHATYGRILRVTHAGGLEGTWTSPTYDLGAVLNRRWWINFDLAYSFANGTWESVLAGRTWAEVFGGGLTWHQVFGDPSAGRIVMEFFYSEDGTAWNTTKDFQLLASEVGARYVYYTITIVDGSSESYTYLKPATLKGSYWQ